MHEKKKKDELTLFAFSKMMTTTKRKNFDANKKCKEKKESRSKWLGFQISVYD